MPKLDARLKMVAQQIRTATHVDIGSDHGYLLWTLLKSGRIQRGIAIENKREPFLKSQRTLADVLCDVRLGDGLSALNPGEAESLSICGMGGLTMVQILGDHPDRIPDRLVLQPNRHSDSVRRWASENGFCLDDEKIAWGHWPYDVMTFRRSNLRWDPAYDDVDQELGFAFGPGNLKRKDERFRSQLLDERTYLLGFSKLHTESRKRLELLEAAITFLAELADHR